MRVLLLLFGSLLAGQTIPQLGQSITCQSPANGATRPRFLPRLTVNGPNLTLLVPDHPPIRITLVRAGNRWGGMNTSSVFIRRERPGIYYASITSGGKIEANITVKPVILEGFDWDFCDYFDNSRVRRLFWIIHANGLEFQKNNKAGWLGSTQVDKDGKQSAYKCSAELCEGETP